MGQAKQGTAHPHIATRGQVTVVWEWSTAGEVNPLLASSHYLGPLKSARLVFAARVNGEVAGAMVWRTPTSRRLPSDGSWLELSRWCLTPELGANAGSQAHRAVTRLLRQDALSVTTLVSYSDPSVGHTGALYRACNWLWAPTWLRLRPPPTGNGSWQTEHRQSVKDRWVFCTRKDDSRASVLEVGDRGAIRYWLREGEHHERTWALKSPALDLRQAAETIDATATDRLG